MEMQLMLKDLVPDPTTIEEAEILSAHQRDSLA
jgi:hypothetical protein